MRVAVRALLLACGMPLAARAQTISGVVRDSASGRPIPGVVVSVLDSANTTLRRTITTETGSYRLAGAPNAVRIRAQRIGLRPREIELPQRAPERLDIAMSPIATMLTPVTTVSANRCPRRADAAAALALLDQARSGLLAIAVARDANPAALLTLTYERTLNDRDSVVAQTVRLDSRASASRSFAAVRSAGEFVTAGFTATTRDGDAVYYAPDVETLVDDAFTRGYCFRLARPDAARPQQLGVEFVPATKRGGRIDIDGTLWIDTAARALRDIDFRYLGLDRNIEALKPGGHVSFREMPNGLVLIDRWSLRLVNGEIEKRDGYVTRAQLEVQESGGEVARAEWPNGITWRGSLGAARFHLVKNDGHTPARGAIVRLFETSYEAQADSTGLAEIQYLLPGPYAVVLTEPQYAKYGVRLETPTRFVAVRDSTFVATLRVPNVNERLAGQCAQDKRAGGTVMVLGRVETSDGKPVAGARWSASLLADGRRRPIGSGVTSRMRDKNGVFELCSPIIGDNDVMTFEARTETSAGSITVRLVYPTTLVTIHLDERR